jgi:hypothetical protein
MADDNVPVPSALSTVFGCLGAALPLIAVAESRVVTRPRVVAPSSAVTTLGTGFRLDDSITTPRLNQRIAGAAANEVPNHVSRSLRGAAVGARL